MAGILTACICAICAAPIIRADAAGESAFSVTRAEAAMVLFAIKRIVVPDIINDAQYPDVLEGKWYTKHILFAAQRGMIDAEPATGLLFPHRPITRAEFLKMVAVLYELPLNQKHSYTDVPKGSWYDAYAGIARWHSLFYEKNNPNVLNPNAFLSHKEVVDSITVIEFFHPEKLSAENEVSRNVFIRPSTGFAQQNMPSQPSTVAIQERIENPSTENTDASTVGMVKDAMVNLLQKNALIGDQTEIDVIGQVNEERSKAGLPKLRNNPVLAAAAEKHAKDMFKRGYFSHFTPEGGSFVDRALDAGFADPDPRMCTCSDSFIANWSTKMQQIKKDLQSMQSVMENECNCTPEFAVGENIARGQLTPKQVMKEWLASPSHKKNILRSEFEETGVGVYGDVWVQKFGRIRYHIAGST